MLPFPLECGKERSTRVAVCLKIAGLLSTRVKLIAGNGWTPQQWLF